jgi:tetratricopeptide (TPR) repeat protein
VEDELTALLATGERAAFHGRPGAGVAPLTQAVAVAHASGQDTEATAAAWLLGVCLGAAGRYGSAMKVLEPLATHDSADPGRRLFSSLASATLGSIHRQLGRHEAARALDLRALERADGAAEAVFDARLGLAADAVGLDERDEAEAQLAAAVDLVDDRTDWWRQRVRLGWVRAEVALLLDDATAAARAAASAVALAETSGAPRHVAKGLLFEGVALAQAGDEESAVATLRRASALAESLGTLPLLWPSRAVLGALLAGEHPVEAKAALASARDTVRAIGADLPPDLLAGWQGRPDLVALLSEPGD